VNDKYEILAGHRRYYAAKQLEWDEIAVNVISNLDDDLERLIHLDENLERKDLNIARREKALSEKSHLYKKLVLAGLKNPGDFKRETIDQTGLSKTAIYRGVRRHDNASDMTWDAYTHENIGSIQLDELIKLTKNTQDDILKHVMTSTTQETRAIVAEELAKRSIPAGYQVKHPKLGTIHAEKFAKLFHCTAEKMLDMFECFDDGALKSKVSEKDWELMIKFAYDLRDELKLI
jgi:hypothetical protein